MLVWNEFSAIGRPVIGLKANSTDWDGRNFGPEFLVCRSSKHHGRNLQHRRIVLGEFETCILERFAEVIQFGKVDMTNSAARAVSPGKCPDGITPWGAKVARASASTRKTLT